MAPEYCNASLTSLAVDLVLNPTMRFPHGELSPSDAAPSISVVERTDAPPVLPLPSLPPSPLSPPPPLLPPSPLAPLADHMEGVSMVLIEGQRWVVGGSSLPSAHSASSSGSRAAVGPVHALTLRARDLAGGNVSLSYALTHEIYAARRLGATDPGHEAMAM